MNNWRNFGNSIRKISTGFQVTLFFTMVLLYFFIGTTIDRVICYERVSRELDVPSDPVIIWNTLRDDLNSKIKVGSTYEQAFSILEASNSSYKTIWRYPDAEGGFKVYVSLGKCIFAKNDFTFLFYFSETEELIDIINYVED